MWDKVFHVPIITIGVLVLLNLYNGLRREHFKVRLLIQRYRGGTRSEREIDVSSRSEACRRGICLPTVHLRHCLRQAARMPQKHTKNPHVQFTVELNISQNALALRCTFTRTKIYWKHFTQFRQSRRVPCRARQHSRSMPPP